ncbi:iron-sulfur cluster biosynthesis family protein [Sphaerisporangium sp. TRM90804]|uniref:iron-sulfur cluster biosynthesis family protein n=1 Tax=Sphaerisporangium sp. TRM90804 TaxID=3031113 RepID=UPI00244D32C5|nr:iron-sulfur cluster biosynthesis family protein [Sphaerisporangium sp. TRM90804]MDH2424928.1 iron-sulfur cluster biosynthesis family protein [Sphaerisporangium sp. TRM90804]
MLTLTDTAAKVIRDLNGQAEGPAERGIRISSQGEDAGSLMLSVAEGPENTDKVIESAGARVYLDPVAATVLDDKALDADIDDQGGVSFHVENQIV